MLKEKLAKNFCLFSTLVLKLDKYLEGLMEKEFGKNNKKVHQRNISSSFYGMFFFVLSLLVGGKIINFINFYERTKL